jgi:hypothetical protein
MEYYSIHNLLKIASNTKIPVPEYFRVQEQIKEPDIEILEKSLSFVKPKENKLMRANYYFWREKKTLFIDCDVANAKLLIEDLFGKTRIKCTKTFKRFSTEESWGDFIRAVLWFKLTEHGSTFVHSGCLSYKGKEGVLILGLADTGKTSTILSLLSTGMFSYLSDDITILGDGVAYAYPEEVKISPYTLTGSMPVASSWKRRVLRSRLLSLFSERLLKMKITESYKIPDKFVVAKNPVGKVFILGGYDKRRKARKVERAAAARTLFLLSVEVSKLMHKYIDPYYYLFGIDTFNVLRRMKEIVENSLKSAECFELKTPDLKGYAETITKIMG